ncbi:MAG: BON domain-containing protein [Polyangiales bacterium]
MKHFYTCAAALLACACATNESARRPAATAQTEPAPSPRSAVDPVSPVHVESPRGREPTRVDSEARAHSDGLIEPERDSHNTRERDRDNTAVNTRDRDDAVTPMDQGNHASDLETTRKIRDAVTSDDSLSFSAKNVKIISSGGKVTLRGTVNTDAERRAIENYSRQVVGAGRVNNQIEVEH